MKLIIKDVTANQLAKLTKLIESHENVNNESEFYNCNTQCTRFVFIKKCKGYIAGDGVQNDMLFKITLGVVVQYKERATKKTLLHQAECS